LFAAVKPAWNPVKTTVEMPDKLFRRAKATAAQRGQSLKQLITAALERELSQSNRVACSARPRRAQVQATMRELKKISKRVSAAWPEGVSAVDAIREQRRDL
jgi:hypothetical protein